MGCGVEFLEWLSSSGRVPARGRWLDIGESCLMAGDAATLKALARRHGCVRPDAELDPIIAEYARRSNLMGDPVVPTLFLGELLALTEVEYVAFDVVSARGAERFDLNRHRLHPSAAGTFDIVTNFGTTEHLLNQYNAFEVIHDAVKPGGYIFHQVPSTGYLNHGFFCYNLMLFEELARANSYEIADLWYYGPGGSHTVLEHSSAHPGVLDPRKPQNNVDLFRTTAVPDSLIDVLFRKVSDAPFSIGLELSTSAAAYRDATFTSRFIAPERAPSSPERAPSSLERALARLRELWPL